MFKKKYKCDPWKAFCWDGYWAKATVQVTSTRNKSFAVTLSTKLINFQNLEKRSVLQQVFSILPRSEDTVWVRQVQKFREYSPALLFSYSLVTSRSVSSLVIPSCWSTNTSLDTSWSDSLLISSGISSSASLMSPNLESGMCSTDRRNARCSLPVEIGFILSIILHLVSFVAQKTSTITTAISRNKRIV